VGKGFDLIIWPETALPLVFDEEVYVKRLVKTIPSVTDSYLVLGTLTKDNRGRFYNTAYVLGPGGDECIYNKVHLVPFGEYTPCRTYLSFLDKMSVANGEFYPGRTLKPVVSGAGKLGVLICYEGIFPDISREIVRNGAQVLINMTNDAWYDNTSAPYQHLAFYVFRAVETDRYVIRSSNTGISAIIDPRGRIVKKAPMFTEASLKGEFVLKDSKTFYVKHGDYFVLLSLIVLAALCVIHFFIKRLNPGDAGDDRA
jgi:apolipoprotein N-acyltransferase